MQRRTGPGGGRAGASARGRTDPRAGGSRFSAANRPTVKLPRTEPRGSSARPVAARRTAAQVGAAKRTRAPEPRRFTGRAMILSLVLLGLLLAYAYPVRVYLAQQAEIAALEDSQASQREKIERLNEQAAKWNDPEYVKSQARSRLHMVLPGEKPMIVIDQSGGQPSGPGAGQTGTAKTGKPWYGKLWSSIEAANQ
jgi:cell division protein FtsB